MISRSISIAISISIASALIASCGKERRTTDRVVGLFGSQGASIIRDADVVEMRLLASVPEGVTRHARSRWVGVGSQALTELKDLLLHDANYRWDEGAACAPKPAVEVRFTRAGRTATFALSFGCDRLVGETGAAFEPIRAELIRITKGAFPGDPIVQRL